MSCHMINTGTQRDGIKTAMCPMVHAHPSIYSEQESELREQLCSPTEIGLTMQSSFTLNILKSDKCENMKPMKHMKNMKMNIK